MIHALPEARSTACVDALEGDIGCSADTLDSLVILHAAIPFVGNNIIELKVFGSGIDQRR
jgi:hypothetical protein